MPSGGMSVVRVFIASLSPVRLHAWMLNAAGLDAREGNPSRLGMPDVFCIVESIDMLL
jgi:hypothetical protein